MRLIKKKIAWTLGEESSEMIENNEMIKINLH